jgi:hypothetical protein
MLHQGVLRVNGMEWNYGSYVTFCTFLKVNSRIASHDPHVINCYIELHKSLVTFISINAMFHGF